jgi:hypothetical protein
MPLSDLERRLRTDRTLDIFTMKPKVCLIPQQPHGKKLSICAGSRITYEPPTAHIHERAEVFWRLHNSICSPPFN